MQKAEAHEVTFEPSNNGLLVISTAFCFSFVRREGKTAQGKPWASFFFVSYFS